MRQYQQWLHYREVEQQLHAQLETLERELAQLLHGDQPTEHSEQTPQADLFSKAHPPEHMAFEGSFLAANQLMLALAAGLNGQAPSSPPPPHTYPPIANQGVPVSGQSAETISPALFAWSNLPNFATRQIPGASSMSAVPSFNTNFDQPQTTSRVSHQEIALLPEDMSSFIDEHSLTDPQIELPWWLRSITIASRTNNSSGPIDQESIRTNRLVQRWLERWGLQPSPQNSPGVNNHE